MKGLILGALCCALTACTPALGHTNNAAPPTEEGVTVPRCPKVFKVGRTLPDPFFGCIPADRDMGYDTGAMPTVCLDGRTLFVWDDTRWAFPGQAVKLLGDGTRDYALAVLACTGSLPTPTETPTTTP